MSKKGPKSNRSNWFATLGAHPNRMCDSLIVVALGGPQLKLELPGRADRVNVVTTRSMIRNQARSSAECLDRDNPFFSTARDFQLKNCDNNTEENDRQRQQTSSVTSKNVNKQQPHQNPPTQKRGNNPHRVERVQQHKQQQEERWRCNGSRYDASPISTFRSENKENLSGETVASKKKEQATGDYWKFFNRKILK